MLKSFVRSLLVGSLVVQGLSLGSAWAQVRQELPAFLPSANPSTSSPPAKVASSATIEGGIGISTEQVVPAAYLKGSQGMLRSDVEAILSDPMSLFRKSDLPSLVSRQVRLLVGSDNRGVQAMINLAKNPEVGSARLGPIAVGLAQATRAAPPSDIAYGAFIQEAVVRSGSEELIAAYAAVLQMAEVETASLGSSAGGGASSSGSLGGVGSPGISNGFNGDDTVPQTSNALGSASRGSVAFSENGDGLGETVFLSACTDPSAVGLCLN